MGLTSDSRGGRHRQERCARHARSQGVPAGSCRGSSSPAPAGAGPPGRLAVQHGGPAVGRWSRQMIHGSSNLLECCALRLSIRHRALSESRGSRGVAGARCISGAGLPPRAPRAPAGAGVKPGHQRDRRPPPARTPTFDTHAARLTPTATGRAKPCPRIGGSALLAGSPDPCQSTTDDRGDVAAAGTCAPSFANTVRASRTTSSRRLVSARQPRAPRHGPPTLPATGAPLKTADVRLQGVQTGLEPCHGRRRAWSAPPVGATESVRVAPAPTL